MASDSKDFNQSDTVRSKSLIRNSMSSMEEFFPNSKRRVLSILPIKKEVKEQRLYKGRNDLIWKNEKKNSIHSHRIERK